MAAVSVFWDTEVGNQYGKTWDTNMDVTSCRKLYKTNDIYNKSKNLESALESLPSSSTMETFVIVSSTLERKEKPLPTATSLQRPIVLGQSTFFCP